MADNVYHYGSIKTEDVQEIVQKFHDSQKQSENQERKSRSDSRKSINKSKRKLDMDEQHQQQLFEEEETISTSRALFDKTNVSRTLQIRNVNLIMPPPLVPPPPTSNSEIKISKVGKDVKIVNERLSLTMLNVQDSPVKSLTRIDRSRRARLNAELNQNDSKDETELINSQSQQFIKKKSKHQNSSGESLTSNASSSNSTINPRNPFGTSSDNVNITGRIKKRKTSPPVTFAPPSLSSTHIANRSQRKAVNNIFDSDEDDNFIEMPSAVDVTRQKIKPSPIVKNKSKPQQQQQRIIEDTPEKPASQEKIFKKRPSLKNAIVEEDEEGIIKSTQPPTPNVTDDEGIPEAQPTSSQMSKKSFSTKKNLQSLSSSHIANSSQRKAVNNIFDSDNIIEMPSAVDVTREPPKISQKSKKNVKRIEEEEDEEENSKQRKRKGGRLKLFPKPSIRPIQPREVVNKEGLRRSERTRVKPFERPIYETEFLTDCYGHQVRIKKIVATQRIDNDLTRFNAKFLKLNYNADVYEGEEEKKEKFSTKKRYNKPAADSSSEDEETLKNKDKREKKKNEIIKKRIALVIGSDSESGKK